MSKLLKLSRRGLALLVVAVAIGCASDSGSKKAAAPEPGEGKSDYKHRQYVANPSKVKFGEFKYVQLRETELAPEHSNNKNNEASAKKIDAMLLAELQKFWPDIEVLPKDSDLPKPAERTLQISPYITDIKMVTVSARVWLGVMAGGSDIVMHVDYRDSSTGEIIANPDFWKGNNAWSGGNSWGQSDNQIRDAVVGQIVLYTAGNK
jgi:hypothetical protein